MKLSQSTSIDLIFAETDAERITLEKHLGVTQEEMTRFYFDLFMQQGLLFCSVPPTPQDKLEVVREAIRWQSAGTAKGNV